MRMNNRSEIAISREGNNPRNSFDTWIFSRGMTSDDFLTLDL